ncbi:MAG: hypothetical protein ACI8RD_004723 [Bacillariaceae sp.]|jgi:hypothetical protein
MLTEMENSLTAPNVTYYKEYRDNLKTLMRSKQKYTKTVDVMNHVKATICEHKEGSQMW